MKRNSLELISAQQNDRSGESGSGFGASLSSFFGFGASAEAIEAGALACAGFSMKAIYTESSAGVGARW